MEVDLSDATGTAKLVLWDGAGAYLDLGLGDNIIALDVKWSMSYMHNTEVLNANFVDQIIVSIMARDNQ